MKEARIIVLAGQSNAVGVGYSACLPKHFSEQKLAEYDRGYEKIKINYFSHDIKSNGFVATGKNCTEATKDTVGPELGMAEYLHEKEPDAEYFIVKCAFGGKSLHRDFLPPSCGAPYEGDAYAVCFDENGAGNPACSGWAYNELVKLTHESINKLQAQGYQPQIIGFCWMQGESDACDAETALQYGKRYETLIADWKAAFAPVLQNCQFADAGISDVWPCYEQVNQEKQAYAGAHENCHYIDTLSAGLTTAHEPPEAPDLAHYDSNSIIKLGRLFAHAVTAHRL